VSRKPATQQTRQHNEGVKQDPLLDWSDERDFDFAKRGFVARLDEPVIRNARGRTVWDLTDYAFLEPEQAPSTVNPSLWRQARLNMLHGLFRIHERIYQVRGHDLSVISFLVGDEGYVVIDPLISAECARSALELLYEHVGERPVTAVIYTHSHIDHYGGVEGVVSREDVAAGKVRVLAPEGFTHAAISENVIAGNAMTRRAMYMYGNLLPRDAQGQVDAGLGKTTSRGSVSMIEPTESITRTGTTMVVDGIEIVFQVTPDTEAPAEMNFHFPQFDVLCMAENCSHNQHNLYTLRGAPVRDARAWAYYIDEALELFVDKSDMVFSSHHWPIWGRDAVREYLCRQRDMYKYLHDQTLRLANHGLTPLEIADGLELPPSLAKQWYNRAYYGSVSHNSRAVYQRYLGFFDGNPAHLDPLPPEDAGRRYVELAGGADALLARAREAYEQGEYRWVAQLVDHLVFADPSNEEARQLEADALEQMGYQTENAPWRNFFLTGAQELRAWQPSDGSKAGGAAGGGMVSAVGLDLLFDLLAVRFDGAAFDGRRVVLELSLSDTGETAELRVENCVLHGAPGRGAEDADARLRLERPTLDALAVGRLTLAAAIEEGRVQLEGDREVAIEVLDGLDRFDRWFAVVTP
jgi:alkyl sulfatase BDS1-like metallo-beta-lactamase superfamily hydrolase